MDILRLSIIVGMPSCKVKHILSLLAMLPEMHTYPRFYGASVILPDHSIVVFFGQWMDSRA